MIYIESGAYQFRIKYTTNDGSLYVDYLETTCKDHEQVKSTYATIRGYHGKRASGEIIITHKAIRGLYGDGE